MRKQITLIVTISLLLIVLLSIVYEYFGLLSSDERAYISAMCGYSIERHIGFWLPASIAYKALNTIGVRIYNIVLYTFGVIILVYYSRDIKEPVVRLLAISSFVLNPFIIYFVPRILSEATGYTLVILSFAFASKYSFLSGLLWGLGFISKYYLIITMPFILSVIYRSRPRITELIVFMLGVILPVSFMFLYSYVTTGDALYVVMKAGPELRKPLTDRHFIIPSLLLSLVSILVVSFPFTRELITSFSRAWKSDRIVALGFILMAISNATLGFLHMTGMENMWRYKDHIRLASLAVPTFSIMEIIFPPKDKATKYYIAAVTVLSIITVVLLLILRLKTYHII